MSIPVTSRLDESVVVALDRAVAAGLAASRGGAVAAAVSEWLGRHGEDASIPGAGSHRVVVVTRDTAIPLITSVVCVLVTPTYRGHVAEVELGANEGLDHDSVANCDNVFTLPKSALKRRRGQLDEAKRAEIGRALTIALGLDS